MLFCKNVVKISWDCTKKKYLLFSIYLYVLSRNIKILSYCFEIIPLDIFFSGHLRRVGKGVGVKKIGTYPFTSPVRNIVLEPSLLHALTDTGTYLVKFRNPV